MHGAHGQTLHGWAAVLAVADAFLRAGCVLQVADRLEKAVNKALDDGYRTKDIWTEGHKLVKCSEMGDVLANSVA